MGFLRQKKWRYPRFLGGISTSVAQRYKISERNANPLTLVNANIISHFSSFFGCKMEPYLTGVSDIVIHCSLRPLRLCVKIPVVIMRVSINSRKGAKGRKEGNNIKLYRFYIAPPSFICYITVLLRFRQLKQICKSLL